MANFIEGGFVRRSDPQYKDIIFGRIIHISKKGFILVESFFSYPSFMTGKALLGKYGVWLEKKSIELKMSNKRYKWFREEDLLPVANLYYKMKVRRDD